MNFLELTPFGFEKFIQNYTDAVAHNKELFEFQGQIIATNYAKYLIEYYTQKNQPR